MEDNNYYSNPPDENPKYGDRGTAPLVLGILSLVSSLTVSRVVGLVLGIIAVCLGNKHKHVSEEAKIGFILGIIGICISAIVIFAFFSFFGMAFIPFFWF